MISRIRKSILVLMAILLLVPAGLVTASDLTEEIGPCPGENVTGTIVGIDENGVVTIDTGDGQCTVTLTGDYSHPIVELLAEFYGEIELSTYEDSLNNAEGCAVISGSEGTWSECGDDTEAIQVTAYDEENNTFTAIVLSTGETITLTVEDEAVVDELKATLDELTVDWELDGNGDVVLTSDQIAAYHDQGLGFGVLVKLYALSSSSGVPVEDLIAEFEAGTGMGELYALYGKPDQTGVGHVRQELKEDNNGQANGKEKDKDKSNNGKGKGKGK